MNIKQIFTWLLAVIVLSLTACKSSPKDALVRKWKATDASGSIITPEMKAQITGEGNTIEFMKDGNYVAWSNGKENDKGTYTLTEDGKTLITKKASGGASQTVLLKELTKDKMIADMGAISITFEPSK